MISKVSLKFFKRFAEQEFHLADTIVLAGPNNSGKSTLLQAIAVWNLALPRWMAERGSSKAKERTGIPISRKDFTAIPLREMNLLWSARDTAYKKDERAGAKPGEHKLIGITLFGKDSDGNEWNLGVNLRYSNEELIYVSLTNQNGEPVTEVPFGASGLQIVHVPPFSGIGAEETRYDRGYQNLLVGQGKPGDILRNLLLEVFQQKDNGEGWQQLKEDIAGIFGGQELLDPRYADADPYILVEYRDGSSASRKPFDIASAGSGFHQVLVLLGFFYARPASVLLLDEPDAHQHVILQRHVFDRLRQVARRRKCQLLIATHSEVILEGTEPDNILSFYGTPHVIQIGTERDQLREALKRLSSLDILSAESGSNILYLEDESSFKILSAFASILNHRALDFFNTRPFFLPLNGHDVREAKAHFFSLKAVNPNIRGVLLLDGDNRNLPDREVGAEGLRILRWRRYEVENYLIHPTALLRFVEGTAPLFAGERRDRGKRFLEGELPPAALNDPLGDHEFLISVPASKTLLPSFFEMTGTPIKKKEYYQIAAQMQDKEVHNEVREKLDQIADDLL